MTDYRKNSRYRCLVPVDGKDGSVFDQVQTVNFSKGGLGFISKRRIPLNKEIPIEIELTSDGDPIYVMGRVEWVQRILKTKTYRVGVSFKDVIQGSKSRLNQHFKKDKVS